MDECLDLSPGPDNMRGGRAVTPFLTDAGLPTMELDVLGLNPLCALIAEADIMGGPITAGLPLDEPLRFSAAAMTFLASWGSGGWELIIEALPTLLGLSLAGESVKTSAALPLDPAELGGNSAATPCRLLFSISSS